MKTDAPTRATTCWWCESFLVGEHRSCVLRAGPAQLREWDGTVRDFSSAEASARATCSGCEPLVEASDAAGLARRLLQLWMAASRIEALTVPQSELTKCFGQLLARVHPDPAAAHLDGPRSGVVVAEPSVRIAPDAVRFVEDLRRDLLRDLQIDPRSGTTDLGGGG